MIDFTAGFDERAVLEDRIKRLERTIARMTIRHTFELQGAYAVQAEKNRAIAKLHAAVRTLLYRGLGWRLPGAG